SFFFALAIRESVSLSPWSFRLASKWRRNIPAQWLARKTQPTRRVLFSLEFYSVTSRRSLTATIGHCSFCRSCSGLAPCYGSKSILNKSSFRKLSRSSPKLCTPHPTEPKFLEVHLGK